MFDLEKLGVYLLERFDSDQYRVREEESTGQEKPIEDEDDDEDEDEHDEEEAKDADG